jgi:hypothetical protein
MITFTPHSFAAPSAVRTWLRSASAADLDERLAAVLSWHASLDALQRSVYAAIPAYAHHLHARRLALLAPPLPPPPSPAWVAWLAQALAPAQDHDHPHLRTAAVAVLAGVACLVATDGHRLHAVPCSLPPGSFYAVDAQGRLHPHPDVLADGTPLRYPAVANVVPAPAEVSPTSVRPEQRLSLHRATVVELCNGQWVNAGYLRQARRMPGVCPALLGNVTLTHPVRLDAPNGALAVIMPIRPPIG